MLEKALVSTASGGIRFMASRVSSPIQNNLVLENVRHMIEDASKKLGGFTRMRCITGTDNRPQGDAELYDPVAMCGCYGCWKPTKGRE